MSSTNNRQNAVEGMRRRALDVNRAFLKMRPLFISARRLSLNAEITCSVVGDSGNGLIVVVRELRAMTETLREMIARIETVFREVVTLTADWMSTEGRQHYYRAALDQMRSRRGRDAVDWPRSHEGSPMLSEDLSPAEQRVWRAVEDSDAQIFDCLQQLAYTSRELLVLLNRSNWTAVRQSEYLAVLAALEASRWNERRDSVLSIAASMREIAHCFRSIQEEAGDHVDMLMDHIQAVRGDRALYAKEAA